MEHSPSKVPLHPSPATSPPASPAPIPSVSTGKKWVCQDDDPYRYRPVPPKPDEITDKMGPHETGCVPCLLKNLFRNYWKKYEMDPKNLTPESEPLPFSANDEALMKLHNLADRWFCRDPEGWPQQLVDEEERRDKDNKEIPGRNRKAEKKNQKIRKMNIKRSEEGEEEIPLEDLEELWNIPMKDEEKEEYQIEQRRLQSKDQQCIAEYLMFIFQGITSSIDMTNIHGQRRNNQFDALFTVTNQQWATCLPCGERYLSGTNGEKGINIQPNDTGDDTVSAAIVRALNAQVHGVNSSCNAACKKADQAREEIIEDAPEYLRIPVGLESWDRAKQRPVKNLEAFEIPDVLDLTAHMEQTDDLEPVRYRLLHVIYHQGESMKAGHYAAGVTSAHSKHAGCLWKGETSPRAPQWFCNDSRVKKMRKRGGGNVLTINPVNWSNAKRTESDYNPRLLWYVREPAPARVRGEVEAEETVSEGGIAKRVRKWPRQNRGQRVQRG